MKSGMTLTQLATEVERQHEAKRDYIADSRRVVMTADAKGLELETVGAFPMTQHAKRQLANKLEVPATFYDRLETKHPDLLSGMVNALFRREPMKAMVRTLDGSARCIASDSFRPLDNYDLCDAVLPSLLSIGAEVQSCDITETKMYIKATIPGLDRTLPVPEGAIMGQGHTIFPRALRGAISVSTSEVGAGRLVIAPAMLEKQCTNLMVFKDDGYGVIHLGKRKGQDDAISEYFTDDTKRLEDAAIWSKVRDVIAAICAGKVMDKLVAQLLTARADIITGDPAAVVEVFGKKNLLSEEERGGLLRHLVTSGEMTRYGLQWAVTRLANDAKDYDRASDLERLGGQVIELPRTEWTELLKRAA